MRYMIFLLSLSSKQPNEQTSRQTDRQTDRQTKPCAPFGRTENTEIRIVWNRLCVAFLVFLVDVDWLLFDFTHVLMAVWVVLERGREGVKQPELTGLLLLLMVSELLRSLLI